MLLKLRGNECALLSGIVLYSVVVRGARRELPDLRESATRSTPTGTLSDLDRTIMESMSASGTISTTAEIAAATPKKKSHWWARPWKKIRSRTASLVTSWNKVVSKRRAASKRTNGREEFEAALGESESRLATSIHTPTTSSLIATSSASRTASTTTTTIVTTAAAATTTTSSNAALTTATVSLLWQANASEARHLEAEPIASESYLLSPEERTNTVFTSIGFSTVATTTTHAPTAASITAPSMLTPVKNMTTTTSTTNGRKEFEAAPGESDSRLPTPTHTPTTSSLIATSSASRTASKITTTIVTTAAAATTTTSSNAALTTATVSLLWQANASEARHLEAEPIASESYLLSPEERTNTVFTSLGFSTVATTTSHTPTAASITAPSMRTPVKNMSTTTSTTNTSSTLFFKNDAAGDAKSQTIGAPSGERRGSAPLKSLMTELQQLSELELYQRFITDWSSTQWQTFQKPIRDIVVEWEYFLSRLPDVGAGVKGPWSAYDRQAVNTLKLMSWEPTNYGLTRFMHRASSELRNRIAWPCYQKQSLANKKLLVIGAGPGGLRLAVEARLNGADVTLLERRESFTRMNVLYIWNFTREDMISLGIKDMWPSFVTRGDKMTVPIAYLQHALLRVALTLGVEVRAGCSFTSLVPSFGHTHWVVRASCVRRKFAYTEDIEFDAIIDATGAHPVLRSYTPPSQSKPLVLAGPTARKQSENFAITANFKRYDGDFQRQFSLTYQYSINKFNLRRVALTSIAYHRSPIAHYMVAGIGRDILLEHGVARDDVSGDRFLSAENINQEALLRIANTVADDWDIPHREGFFEEGPDGKGRLKPSAYAFEFTKLMEAEVFGDIIQPPETQNFVADASPFVDSVANQTQGSKQCQFAVPGSAVRWDAVRNVFSSKTCKCEFGMRLFGSDPKCKGRKFNPIGLKGKNCSCKGIQPVLLVGDAALSPFWPEGTGANRAFLGAVQQTWNLKHFFNLQQKAEKHLAQGFAAHMGELFSKLKSSKSDACSRCQYQGFMKDGYDGKVEDVCRPIGQPCVQGNRTGPFDRNVTFITTSKAISSTQITSPIIPTTATPTLLKPGKEGASGAWQHKVESIDSDSQMLSPEDNDKATTTSTTVSMAATTTIVKARGLSTSEARASTTTSTTKTSSTFSPLGNGVADTKSRATGVLFIGHNGWVPSQGITAELEQLSKLDLYQRFITSWSSTEREIFQKPIRDIVAEWEYFLNRLPDAQPGVKGPWLAKDRQAAKTLKLMSWKPTNYGLTRFMHRPRSELPNRIAWPCYQKQSLANRTVLVIGAGPGGLRLAIEARLNGANVTLLERRESFTRMNVLYIWEFSREDMISLGIKDMWPSFVTSGDKTTVPIAYLQHAMLRVALTLGVEVRAGCSFTSLVPTLTHTHWVVRASCVPDASIPNRTLQEDFGFDAIVDGTGAHPVVRSYKPPSQSKPLILAGPTARKQAENFAITANFKRYDGDFRQQFSLAYQYNIDKFNSRRVALTSIVYYKSPIAHYMVAGIGKDTLLEHGIVREDISGDSFLSRENVDQEALLRTANAMADDWDIPHKEGFYEEGPDGKGRLKPSAYAFEFTKLMVADAYGSIIPPPETQHAVADASLVVDSVVNQTQGSKCCCHQGPCHGSTLYGVLYGKVQVDHFTIDSNISICCKPLVQACADRYNFPAPRSLGFDGSCRTAEKRQCQLAVPGSEFRQGAGYLKGFLSGNICKCPPRMRLFGSTAKCKGRTFNPNDFQGLGCSCKGVQPVILVGDAALSPFWPEGTGANRAFLGAVQQIWSLEKFFHLEQTADQHLAKDFSRQMDKVFSKLKSSQSNTCSRCNYQEFMKHGYDGKVEDVCRPRGRVCVRSNRKGPFDKK